MSLNGTKEDLRIIKTKRALVEAFGKMMQEEPFEKLTVNELCERAGIRRATFYKHFKDKNDFLIFFMKEDRQSFEQKRWRGKEDFKKDYFISHVTNLVENLANNKSFVDNVISSSIKHLLIESIISQNYEDTLAIFKRAKAEGAVLCASCENLTGMLIGGIAVVIYSWCNSGMQQPKEELISEISDIISSILPE